MTENEKRLNAVLKSKETAIRLNKRGRITGSTFDNLIRRLNKQIIELNQAIKKEATI